MMLLDHPLAPTHPDYKPLGPAEPVYELTWRDLKKGDRVVHFEYGVGTVDGAGPVHIYITWDDAKYRRLDHHGSHIADFLRLAQPPPSAAESAAIGQELDEPSRYEVLVGRTIRSRVRSWLDRNRFDAMEHKMRELSRFEFWATDEQWQHFEQWLDNRVRP